MESASVDLPPSEAQPKAVNAGKRKRKRPRDKNGEFRTKLKRMKVSDASSKKKTPLSHLKNLLRRSNFYANSLLGVITEERKRHAKLAQMKLNKRRKKLKEIRVKIAKNYKTKEGLIPSAYQTWLQSEEDQVNFGEKVCFCVATLVSRLVRKTNDTIKKDASKMKKSQGLQCTTNTNSDPMQGAESVQEIDGKASAEVAGASLEAHVSDSNAEETIVDNAKDESFVHEADVAGDLNNKESGIYEDPKIQSPSSCDEIKSSPNINFETPKGQNDQTTIITKQNSDTHQPPKTASTSMDISGLNNDIIGEHGKNILICQGDMQQIEASFIEAEVSTPKRKPSTSPPDSAVSLNSTISTSAKTERREKARTLHDSSWTHDPDEGIESDFETPGRAPGPSMDADNTQPLQSTLKCRRHISMDEGETACMQCDSDTLACQEIVADVVQRVCDIHNSAGKCGTGGKEALEPVHNNQKGSKEGDGTGRAGDPSDANIQPKYQNESMSQSCGSGQQHSMHIQDEVKEEESGSGEDDSSGLQQHVETADGHCGAGICLSEEALQKVLAAPENATAPSTQNKHTERQSQNFEDEDVAVAVDVHTTLGPSSDSQRSETSSKVPCPVCCKLFSTARINVHLDMCLTSKERRSSLRIGISRGKTKRQKRKRKTVNFGNITEPESEREPETKSSRLCVDEKIMKVSPSTTTPDVQPEKSAVAEFQDCSSQPHKRVTRSVLSSACDFVRASVNNAAVEDEIGDSKAGSQTLTTDAITTVTEPSKTEPATKTRICGENPSMNSPENNKGPTKAEEAVSGSPDLEDIVGCGEEEEAHETSESENESDVEIQVPREVRRSTRSTRSRKSYKEASESEDESQKTDAGNNDEEKLEPKVEKRTKSEYSVGDVIEVFWGKGEAAKPYKAVIRERRRTKAREWTYQIHYERWSDRFDDWIFNEDIEQLLNDASERNVASPLLGILRPDVTSDETDSLNKKFYMPPKGKACPVSLLKEKNGQKYFNDIKVSPAQPKLLTGGALRDYQIIGFEWLKTLYENRENGILADEMGLGKTVQCIAIISHMIEVGVRGPFLICAPLSTIQNWFLEFRRFAPKIPLVLYHGSAAERDTLGLCILQKETKLKTRPVVVTTYDVLMRDRGVLQMHKWAYLIVDEGHRIKNLKCKLLRELRYIRSRAKLLLTGTPLQNSLSELWSLLHFLLPEVFDDLKTFETWFNLKELQRNHKLLSMIHQILTPFLLRRMKCDVKLNLPPKKEVVVYAPLTPKQERIYRALVDRSIHDLLQQKEYYKTTMGVADPDVIAQKQNSQKESSETVIGEPTRMTRSKAPVVAKISAPKSAIVNMSMSNVIMQLRKCCNHPYLIEYPLLAGSENLRIDGEIVSSSGKLMILDRLLPELKKRGHKVLLFSQMTRVLDILEDYCMMRGYRNVRLDGQMSNEARVESMNIFNKDKDVFLFLLSTKAGGLGINLTSADTVIIFDSDWNPQNDAQAQDRCHRIGQERPVVVYRLITASTVDQQIVERAAKKTALEKIIMHRSKFKGNLEQELASDSKVHPEELLQLLESSKAKCEVDENSFQAISDENLEKLLDRSKMSMEVKSS